MVYKISIANVEDAPKIFLFMNEIFTTEDEVLRTPQKMKNRSLDDEKKMIVAFSAGRGMMLIAKTSEGEIVGACDAYFSDDAFRKHICRFGISVHKSHRNQGLATNLFRELQKHCQSKEILKLELEVLANNKKAIQLYLKLGFKNEGIFYKSIFCNGAFIDLIRMARFSAYEDI